MTVERDPVTLSQALHCRAEIWLNAHGYEKEPVQPGAQRTFDVGTTVEALMFEGVNASGIPVGPWWPTLPVLQDPINGFTVDPAEYEAEHRQKEIEWLGFKGHIDALLVKKGNSVLVDMKTASGFSYDRAMKGDLLDSPFKREYVGQLHAYAVGLVSAGLTVHNMALIYFNKEQSQVGIRHVPFSQAILDEAEQKLLGSRADAPPTPDWAWEKGKAIPLRCGYCAQKVNCANMRGAELTLSTVKGKPVWTAG